MIGFISEPMKISAKGTIMPKAKATMTGFHNYWQKSPYDRRGETLAKS